MPYLRAFQHDVFVSYARGPVPLRTFYGARLDPLSRWTRVLIDDISGQLDFYLGTKNPERRAEFWMDLELEGNLPLTDNLRRKVQESAILLIVMSPFYLQSDWCGNEVRWFSEQPKRLDEVVGRLFVVRVAPTDENAWPITLKDELGTSLPGYRFHPTVRPGELCEPFGWPVPTDVDANYYELVGRLARDMVKLLQRLSWADDDAVPGLNATVPQSVGRQLFLGHMHDTLSEGDEDLPATLRAAFGQAGVTVLPPTDAVPTDETSLRHALDAYLPQSEAFVLVANEFPGQWPAGQCGGFVSFELDQARARRVPAYLWLHNADLTRVKRPVYRAYLEELREKADEKGLSLSYADIDAFVGSVVARLDKAKEPEPDVERLAVVCANGRGQVAEWDALVSQIVQILDDKDLTSWIAPIDQETGQIRIGELNDTLDQADTILIVCFDQNYKWAYRLWTQIKSRELLRKPQATRIFIIVGEVSGADDFNLPRFFTIHAIDGLPVKQLLAVL